MMGGIKSFLVLLLALTMAPAFAEDPRTQSIKPGESSPSVAAPTTIPVVAAPTADPVPPPKDDANQSTAKKSQLQPAAAAVQKQEFDKGTTLFQAKKYAVALKSFQKAADSGADDGNARTMMGYCYYEMHQYPEALLQYNRAAKDGKLISVKNKAQYLAKRLNASIQGICPGNCLKPSMPGWHKMNVPGKPERLVWMVYPYLDPAGKGGSEYWSNDHMGEVIEYVNGRPIDKGRCPICGGTGRVSRPK